MITLDYPFSHNYESRPVCQTNGFIILYVCTNLDLPGVKYSAFLAALWAEFLKTFYTYFIFKQQWCPNLFPRFQDFQGLLGQCSVCQEKVPQYQDKLRTWTRKNIIRKQPGPIIEPGPPSRSTLFFITKKIQKIYIGFNKHQCRNLVFLMGELLMDFYCFESDLLW